MDSRWRPAGESWTAMHADLGNISLGPLTWRGRWRMRWTALGEWVAWRALKLAPRFKPLVLEECFIRFEERLPSLRNLWSPWKRHGD